MRSFLAFAAAALSVATITTPAGAYLGTDTAGDYAYSDSLNPSDPSSPTYEFASIASTGSSGPSGDSETQVVDLDFEFEFYGELYDEVLISTNGFLSFDLSASSWAYEDPIPTADDPNALIAGLWEDLDADAIYYETLGAAPSRRFVMEYDGRFYGGNAVSFQIVLYEGTDDIVINLQTDGDEDDETTIGIENTDGTDGIEYLNGGTDSVDLDGVTILFSPQREAPRVSIVNEDPTVAEGGSIDLELMATDRQGDPVTITWDTDLDGEYDDHEGETITLSAEGLDGPTVIEASVRAADPSGNESFSSVSIPVLNAPPVMTNLPEEPVVLLIGQEFEFTPEVSDPGGDEVSFELVGFPERMVRLPEGALRWTPLEEDVGEHEITYSLTDDDDGETTAVLTMVVSENMPPDIPEIISPERNDTVDTLRPTLVVANPEDPEGDPIWISFELDTTDIFSDPISSGQVQAGMEGETEWTVLEDLVDGQRYYWRVWATDGTSEGLRVSSTFVVELDDSGGDGDGDADSDGDGDADGDADGDVSVETGCSCGAAGTPSQQTGLVFLLFTVVLGFSRKRQR